MEWWKDTARTYGDTRAKLAKMSWAEYMEYLSIWEMKAVKGMAGVPSATTAKWYGFFEALQDELHRRELAAPKLGDDDWLDGVLRYLYEEVEHAQVASPG